MVHSDKAVEALRSERDRFVAFSFASADILVELDEDANILFMDGAVSGLLGKKAADFTGTPFLELVHTSDSAAMENILFGDLELDRVDHEKIHLHSRFGDPLPFSLSGYKLGALKNHYYLTLTFLKSAISPKELEKRDQGTGLYNKESFATAATERIREASKNGQDVQITLLDLPDLKELLDHLSPEAAQKLLQDISAYLRQTSLGGDSAGMMDDESYSVILDPNVDPDQMMNQLFEITRRADPDGKGIRPVTVCG